MRNVEKTKFHPICEFTMAVVPCSVIAQDQASQYFSIAEGGAHDVPPLTEDLSKLRAAVVGRIRFLQGSDP